MGVVRAARAGLYTFGALWAVLGVAIAVGILDIGIEDSVSRVVVGVLLAADGAGFLVAGRVYRRHALWLDVTAAGLVAVNLVLTVPAQVGAIDLLALVLLGGLLALVIGGMRGDRRT